MITDFRFQHSQAQLIYHYMLKQDIDLFILHDFFFFYSGSWNQEDETPQVVAS